MMRYRYSRWDGTQDPVELSSQELMDEISEDLMWHGDLWRALQRILQRGMRNRDGQRMQGIQDLLQRLRQQRQQTLQRYDLNSILDDIKERLKDIVDTERGGIQQRLEQAGVQPAQQTADQPQGEQGRPSDRESQQAASPTGEQGQASQDDSLRKLLEQMAQRKLAALDQLPEDPAGQIKELTDYEFMDPEAREKFQELLKMLQQQMMQNQFQNMMQALQGVTPEDLQRMKEMLQQLNQMLAQRAQGGQPNFDQFMQQFGDMFGPNPPENLEELMEQLQRRMAQMQSLMDSMSPEMRQQLNDLMQGMLQDQQLSQELAQLSALMEELMPMRGLRQRYPFQGDESVTMEEAMRLMENLQGMDELERQLRSAELGNGMEDIDPDRVRELLGDEAAQTAEQLRQVTELLEEAGFIKKDGNRFELTARGMRKIGQKALKDIFALMRKDRFGQHEVDKRGMQGETSDDTKVYEFGDPFLLHMERTLMNSIYREGPGLPIRLQEKDFEVFQTQYLTQASTVLMLDLSLSMPMRGNFYAAKKVALALDSLIRTQFPKDNLYVIGFADYARVLKRDALHQVTWNEYVMGTNMHHALMLARTLLARHKVGTKQVIMITDGEPTAHLENGRAYFSYPPVPKTFVETLKEVKRCTKEGITINTFMLDRRPYLKDFVGQITRINKGRAFFTTPDHLGEYILVDYVANKRKQMAS